MQENWNTETEPESADWRSLLGQIEVKLDGLTAEIEGVRTLMRRFYDLAPAAAAEPEPRPAIEWPSAPVAESTPAYETETVQEWMPSQPVSEYAPTPAQAESYTAETEQEQVTAEAPTYEAEPVRSEWAPAMEWHNPVSATEPAAEPEVESGPAATELAASSAESAEAPAEDADAEAAMREEVRRAVEQARRELMGETTQEEWAPPKPSLLAQMSFEPPTFNLGSLSGRPNLAEKQASELWSGRDDLTTPPTLVISDVDGRIELARVYDTLDRLECAGHASLMNYTSHSVTVGLSSRANLPEREQIIAAIREAFGRSCEVNNDGARVSVNIASASERGAA